MFPAHKQRRAARVGLVIGRTTRVEMFVWASSARGFLFPLSVQSIQLD